MMIEPNKQYSSPLGSRYSSPEMSYIWSDHNKYTGWRKLWCSLAKNQKSLGVQISDSQIVEMESNISNIDMDRVAEYESQTNHDVVSHMHHYIDVAPSCENIIHTGATSQYLVDNQDIISIRDACVLIMSKTAKVISLLGDFAWDHKSTPTVGLTHLQAAQPVTVGKRAIMWAQDFVTSLDYLAFSVDRHLKFRGIRGTTGTYDSLFKLFDGDAQKVEELNNYIARDMGFGGKLYPITGQTCTRLTDAAIMSVVCMVASSASKMCNDIRLLSGRGEIHEGFKDGQVGSSAMPYKRNPITSEKVCSISRYILSMLDNFYHTASNQWCERSLDDSANRRLSIPEMFLCIDEVLESCIKVVSDLHVNEDVIKKNVEDNKLKYVSEYIMIEATKNGIPRSEIHEKLSNAYTDSDGGKDVDISEYVGMTIDVDNMESTTGNCEDQVSMYVGTFIHPIESHYGVDK
jgi:adenylosuccinate lyase